MANRFGNNLSSEDKDHLLYLPYYLSQAAMANDFYEILTQFKFIRYKIFSSKGTQLLIEDYDFVEELNILISENNKKNLRLIQDTLRLSTTVLNKDPNQLVGQLWGRLQGFYQPAIQNLLEEARKSKNKSLRLRPLTNSLTIPRTPLIYNFTGHQGGVTRVIITPNEEKAISASKWDQTLMIWDLRTNQSIGRLEGHKWFIYGIDVTPDSQKVISASWDCNIKLWDLKEKEEILVVM